MRKLKRRSKLSKALDAIEKVPNPKKKFVKYRWNEHHVKLDQHNQIILRQVGNQDKFELSITHNGWQFNTIRMTREDVREIYKLFQELFITLHNQDKEG